MKKVFQNKIITNQKNICIKILKQSDLSDKMKLSLERQIIAMSNDEFKIFINIIQKVQGNNNIPKEILKWRKIEKRHHNKLLQVAGKLLEKIS